MTDDPTAAGVPGDPAPAAGVPGTETLAATPSDAATAAERAHRDAAAALPADALATERAQAVALFNHAWSLLDLPERSTAEDFDLIHAAHASRWHWGRVGGAQEWAIGEWQCSRVYAELLRPEASLVHAQRCLQLCEEHQLEGFIVASAHEALARAHLVAGELGAARAHRDAAAALAAALDDPEDRAVVDGDLATLPL